MIHNFISYREENENGLLCYFILQKQAPHYKGIVSVGMLPEALASAPIGGYNLYVNYSGLLSGNFIPGFDGVIEEVTAVLWSMASWYLNNRILTDQKKYAKFLIHTT